MTTRKKFRYTVHSNVYHRGRKTDKIVAREPQVLFDPLLKFFGLSRQDSLVINNLEAGNSYRDKWGDCWERIQ